MITLKAIDAACLYEIEDKKGVLLRLTLEQAIHMRTLVDAGYKLAIGVMPLDEIEVIKPLLIEAEQSK